LANSELVNVAAAAVATTTPPASLVLSQWRILNNPLPRAEGDGLRRSLLHPL